MLEILNRLLEMRAGLSEIETMLREVHPWKPGAGWPDNVVYDDLLEVQDWLNVLIETVEGLDNDDKTV